MSSLQETRKKGRPWAAKIVLVTNNESQAEG